MKLNDPPEAALATLSAWRMVFTPPHEAVMMPNIASTAFGKCPTVIGEVCRSPMWLDIIVLS